MRPLRGRKGIGADTYQGSEDPWLYYGYAPHTSRMRILADAEMRRLIGENVKYIRAIHEM